MTTRAMKGKKPEHVAEEREAGSGKPGTAGKNQSLQSKTGSKAHHLPVHLLFVLVFFFGPDLSDTDAVVTPGPRAALSTDACDVS